MRKRDPQKYYCGICCCRIDRYIPMYDDKGVYVYCYLNWSLNFNHGLFVLVFGLRQHQIWRNRFHWFCMRMLANNVNTNQCHHSPSDNFLYKIEITPFFFTVKTSPIPNDLNGVPNFHNKMNKEEKRTYHLIFRFCIINRYAHSNQVIYKKNLTQPDHKEWTTKSKEEKKKKI